VPFLSLLARTEKKKSGPEKNPRAQFSSRKVWQPEFFPESFFGGQGVKRDSGKTEA
jgi:hypothetical protein